MKRTNGVYQDVTRQARAALGVTKTKYASTFEKTEVMTIVSRGGAHCLSALARIVRSSAQWDRRIRRRGAT